jgi:3-hydroxyisobutyrate dehydrogenase-like beta-hydroxyacid dehydrogenase
VSGGPERARAGTLTLMLGGDKALISQDHVQHALDAIGENRYHLGPLGAGHTTKLLNNQIGAGVRAAVLEAAAIAAVQDVDWEAFMQVVRHSSGSSYQFRKKMPRALNREFEPGFDIQTSEKDVRLALELANSIGANTPITTEVYELYKRAIGAGLGAEDTTALVKLFEDTTGVPVESDQDYDDDFLDWTEI